MVHGLISEDSGACGVELTVSVSDIGFFGGGQKVKIHGRSEAPLLDIGGKKQIEDMLPGPSSD